MQNTNSTTQVFTPSDASLAPERTAEYEAAFELTEAELAKLVIGIRSPATMLR